MKVKQVKREKSTSTKGHYVTNSVLLPAVIEAKEMNVVTDKLIKMIQMIAERYSRKHNFVNYSFREDMVSAAVTNLCNNALKFNLEKSNNPFSFYTTAIHHSFLQYIAEEKKHREIRDQLLISAGSNPSFNYQEKTISDSDTMSFNVNPLDDIELPTVKKIVDGVEVETQEVLYRNQHKEPSEGKTYSGSQMVYDEFLGYFVKKEV